MQVRQTLAAVLLAGFSTFGVRAQGIPVIDVANLAQTVQQVINDIAAINNSFGFGGHDVAVVFRSA